MALETFHPSVKQWFTETFEQPTDVQRQAWQAISERRHTLIAAPTGSGKTLAAFLAVIDDLVKDALQQGLRDETKILYVSPLKALSNDIHRNLEEPLAGIGRHLQQQGYEELAITAAVRSGDTPQYQRERMRRKPPHILVTTPESLFILLTSDSGRNMLGTVRTVIVDEIHAIIDNKRGSHLALSLERLQALVKSPITRIGLSATQKPIQLVAEYLVGNRNDRCRIIDCGYQRERDLAIEIPESPLTAVLSMDSWQQIYDRLAQLIDQHHTTLIFVNTRRLAERAARFLAERIGEEFVTAHHGSLAKEHRLRAEQQLKTGQLKALVATASLELGIDIGDIDLVCQLGSPRSISTFLQRIGRSGHRIGALPKGRLFPLTRDDLVECTALLHAVHQGRLDTLALPNGHLDVLAQHLVAEVGCGEWPETMLFDLITRARPYRDLDKDSFQQVIRMLVDGYTTRRGPRSRYLFRDAVNGIVKPRKGAKLAAVTNAGAIPDQFDYDVILEPDDLFVGTLNEDFAFESLAGDVFQLGNTSYRILQVSQGKVRVADAHGQPPNIPFWFGEAPGRSDELSQAVSELRKTISEKLDQSMDTCVETLMTETYIHDYAARQLVEYLATARAALGQLPTQQTIILERFFDDNGDQHLVVHSPYGARVNRAWGLALRKRFCRQFNFELQAAALDDYIVLSLGATHSFPLEEIRNFLKANTVREVLIQAMLAAPMFATHWRWNTTIALAVKRFHNGNKTPPPFQRSDAEDLMALIFPDQLACFENLAGDREVPNHPLVKQTVDDCLHDIMDIESLERILKCIENDDIEIVCRDLSAPSPLAEEILNARPYAFLDDAPAEERRTLAVSNRKMPDILEAGNPGKLSKEAIKRVKTEAWPGFDNEDELHDSLYQTGFILVSDLDDNQVTTFDQLLCELIKQRRAARVTLGNHEYVVCAERIKIFQLTFPAAVVQNEIADIDHTAAQPGDQETAQLELLRSRMTALALVNEQQLLADLQLSSTRLQSLLTTLEHEGFVMRVEHEGRTCWCERGLLARIHRYGISSARQQVKPVSATRFMQFLFQWHGLGEDRRSGEQSLIAALDSLEGFACPAGVWESDIIPARIRNFYSHDLDTLCSSGRFMWLRLPNKRSRQQQEDIQVSKAGLLKNTPVTLLPRGNEYTWISMKQPDSEYQLGSNAVIIRDLLEKKGACFFIDLVRESGLLRTQTEDALAELAACGLISSDSFAGLRALITPAGKRPGFAARHRRRTQSSGIDAAGRWSLISPQIKQEINSGWLSTDPDILEHIARVLLRRYGVVFYQVLARETAIPSWRELLYMYRRLEARGEIRGGRFVEGFSGEQFALPEAAGLLHKTIDSSEIICLSACDPLNLVGIITPGDKVPALSNTRLAFRNGCLVGRQTRDKIDYFQDPDPSEEWEIRTQLTKKNKPASYTNPMPRRQH